MDRHISVTGALAALLALAAFDAPLAHAGQAGDEPPAEIPQERRVIVDVGTPMERVWRLHRGAYLGVHLVELTPELRAHFGVDESAGIMIGSVAEDSPAAAAGLEVGDIITAIDGEPAERRESLARRVAEHEEGDAVTLEIFRDGAYRTVEATVDERARPQLWLDTLGSGHHPGMHWQSDDGKVLLVPPPGSPQTGTPLAPGALAIRPERLDEIMGDLHERLTSPEFTARMLEFRSNTEELEARIKELEERLQELSAQLEKLED